MVINSQADAREREMQADAAFKFWQDNNSRDHAEGIRLAEAVVVAYNAPRGGPFVTAA